MTLPGQSSAHVPKGGQVHANASHFAASVTKEQAYAQVLEQAEALAADNRNWVRGFSPVVASHRLITRAGLVRRH